jgi:hypothetical protein
MLHGFSVQWELPATETRYNLLDKESEQLPSHIHGDPIRRRRRLYTALFLGFFSVLATFSIFLLSRCTNESTIVHAPVLFKPISYEVVQGLFAQSLNSTNDTSFDFVTFYT